MRQIVWASLPLGKGIVLDPFMGSGSTIAAAEFLGLKSIGLELDTEYFKLAKRAVPLVARWEPPNGGNGRPEYLSNKV